MNKIRQWPDEPPGLLLLFTIDTECSIMRQPTPDPERVVDELIFGDFGHGGRPGGIGLQMDMLEQHGFRGCFFLDVLMEYRHGRRALERTVEAIAGRGHEIQLHVHPDHLSASSDPEIAGLFPAVIAPDAGPEPFRRTLELSIELFEQRVGERPIAYRAGGFRIADSHFPVLEECGIRIDSSINPFHNSEVSNWMRTRAQPFWVGDVLEAPPSRMLIGDDPAAWKLRELIPAPIPAQPLSQLPARPDGLPHVLTYVSHSFELLRRRDSATPEAIAAHAERLLPVLPPDLALRPRWRAPRSVRTFGPETDDNKVDAVFDLLRRLAERPDGRCITYEELDGLSDRFGPVESRSVDSIPLYRPQQERIGVVATRIYSGDLLVHLANEGASSATVDEPTGGRLVEGLERGRAEELGRRIDAAFRRQAVDDTLCIRLRTLGVAPAARRGGLPPLAELLFPAADVRAVAGDHDLDWEDRIPWDVSTFCAWLEARGFELREARRTLRGAAEMATIERFAGKLAWLDPTELRTEAVELALTRTAAGARRRESSMPGTHPLADPLSLPAAAAEVYESLRCGQEIDVQLPDWQVPASGTAIVLAMMRAGLEVLGREGSTYRLVRPVELSDIRRIRGLS